ncbi:CoA transferase, partial [Herbaspirillum sp. RTI4]
MSDTPSLLPLSGIRVLDLSRVLAGPWCGMVLGDFGAEVIKVEHPERGDDTRDWGLRIGNTETAYFNSVNRNKRSICLDLQTPEGQQIAQDLAQQCDVVIHNFKFGGIDKLGLGYAQLSKDHPELIYCSITGYDTSGPEAARPGYDLVVQGESGLMAINGEAHQPPLKFGVAAVDLFTGMYSAQAILAALFERQRTGKGRHIEMALYDCGLMITSYYGLESLLLGQDVPRYGNAHPSIVPYGVFDAEDGPLVITVGNNSQFARFCCEVIERPDLAEDERFKNNIGRSANRAILMPELTREIGSRKRKLLLERLTAAKIPCGEVLGLHEALTSKRTNDAGLVTTHAHPVAGSVKVLAPPYRFDGERLPVRSA